MQTTYSLSVRIFETLTKDSLTVPFADFVSLAKRLGYSAVCMRPSVANTTTSSEQLTSLRRQLDNAGVGVTMVTTELGVPLNNADGPGVLRRIDASIPLAKALGARLIRVCLKEADDIPAAQKACDRAAEHGIDLVHQLHTDSLFETTSAALATLAKINRRNFGVIYEPANLVLVGDDYGAKAIAELAPVLRNVYLQNLIVSPDGPDSMPTRARGLVHYRDVPIWSGESIDFTNVLDGLRHAGYHGPITVHQHFAKIMRPEVAAEKSIAFLKSLS